MTKKPHVVFAIACLLGGCYFSADDPGADGNPGAIPHGNRASSGGGETGSNASDGGTNLPPSSGGGGSAGGSGSGGGASPGSTTGGASNPTGLPCDVAK